MQKLVRDDMKNLGLQNKFKALGEGAVKFFTIYHVCGNSPQIMFYTKYVFKYVFLNSTVIRSTTAFMI